MFLLNTEEKFIQKNNSNDLSSDKLVTKVNDYGDFSQEEWVF